MNTNSSSIHKPNFSFIEASEDDLSLAPYIQSATNASSSSTNQMNSRKSCGFRKKSRRNKNRELTH